MLLFFCCAIVVCTLVITVVVGTIEHRRYGESREIDPAWNPTDEVSQDPTTRRVMRVWIDPTSGERHYVPES